MAQLFYELGIAVNTKVDKDIFTGIARVKQYFKQRKIFIFKNCVNLIRELKGYWWGKGDAPVKRDDHALDELRYFVMSMPKTKKPPQILTEIEKDKQKLMRRNKRR